MGSWPTPRCAARLNTQPVTLENAPGHDTLVHFIRPVVDTSGAALTVERRQHDIIANAERPMRLDRAIDHAHHDVGDVELDERNLLTGLLGAERVDAPAGMQHHQAGSVDFGPALGDPGVNGLTVAQRVARCQLALRRALTQQIKGPFANANPAHAVVKTPRTEPHLGNRKIFSFFAEQVRARTTATTVAHFGIA